MLAEIKSIVWQGYFVNKSTAKFILEETSREASCKEAHVEAKNDYLIYKFDQVITRDGVVYKRLFPYFIDGNSQAMCDYILFYKNTAGVLFAVICNLKSNNRSNNQDQLNAGVNFSQFIFETAKRVYPEIFAGVKLNYIRVLFSTKELYSKTNSNKIINLISSKHITEKLVLEHKCRL